MVERIKAMHDRGFVHRDLKPENMVVDRSDDGKIYVIDFGIIKEVKPTPNLNKNQTAQESLAEHME